MAKKKKDEIDMVEVKVVARKLVNKIHKPLMFIVNSKTTHKTAWEWSKRRAIESIDYILSMAPEDSKVHIYHTKVREEILKL